MNKRQPRVIEVDHHRNGIDGASFTVAIIDDPIDGRMLVIDFSYRTEAGQLRDAGHIAVLNLDQATAGNIYMHPHDPHPGGNAYRGDYLAMRYRPLIEAAMEARYERLMAQLSRERSDA
jgi:hypothetical protein